MLVVLISLLIVVCCAAIVVLFIWSMVKWLESRCGFDDATIGFRDFKKYYDKNPSDWRLYDDCVEHMQTHNYIYFGYFSFIAYIIWRYSSEKNAVLIELQEYYGEEE